MPRHPPVLLRAIDSEGRLDGEIPGPLGRVSCDVPQIDVGGSNGQVLGGEESEEAVVGPIFANGAQVIGLLSILRAGDEPIGEEERGAALGFEPITVRAVATEPEDAELICARFA